LQHGEKKWGNTDEKKLCVHPFEEIEVVQGRASENGKCINIDDPLIAFTNRFFGKEINLKIAESDSSDYGAAMQSLKYEPGLDISFHRTIRMPDDDKLHQLPGSLGTFPIYNVSAYADHLPANIVEQGGVFLPMWQREALWINFDAPYPQKYALRVFVGRINAVSGLKMDERVDEAQVSETLQDYVVVPGQEWLDGICVAPGIVRQFVAMPRKWLKAPGKCFHNPRWLTMPPFYLKWVQDTPSKVRKLEKKDSEAFKLRSFLPTRED
jgi:hypothetical protein